MALFVTVTLKDRPEPVEVEITNPDRIRWDLTANKHKWPKFSDAPFMGMTFLAWSAMKRNGHYSDSWESFRDTDCINVEDTSPDESEEDSELGNV